jgi:hypothetical protein
MFDGYEILDIFIGEEIERLARQKPRFKSGPQDIGCLMDFLASLKIRSLSQSRNQDLIILESWKKDFKRRNIPYVVLRLDKYYVSLYKERKADSRIQD